MAATWFVLRPYLLPILQAQSTYGKHPLYNNLLGELLLGVWLRWDAVHYINLAIGGYFGNITGDTLFYPLYFLLIRYLAIPLRIDTVLASLIISTISAFIAFVFLYRIADNFYGEKTARWAVILLCIYPTSFFLFGPYTESLFLALTLAAFWTAYRASWVWTGLLGALASLARGPGIYSPAALLWIAYEQLRPIRVMRLFSAHRRLMPVLLGLGSPVAAGLSFLLWKNWVGFPSVVEIYREYPHVTISNPLNTILKGTLALFHAPDYIIIIEAVSMLVFLSLIILMIIYPRWRRIEWVLYSGLNMGVFLTRYNVAASPLQSMARYVLVLFPVFIMLGDWLSRKGSRVQFIYFSISGAILIVFSCLYTIGWFIG